VVASPRLATPDGARRGRATRAVGVARYRFPMSGSGPELPDAEVRLARYIDAYARDAEEFAFTHFLAEFSEEAYGRLFDVSGDPRMFGVYQITEDTRAAIEALSSVKLDLSRYDYFLECGTTNDPDIPGTPVGHLDETTGHPPPLELSPVFGTTWRARPKMSMRHGPLNWIVRLLRRT